MEPDAELLQTVIQKYELDIVAFTGLEGLLARHPWLGLGHIPAGFYDLARPTPTVDTPVARVATLIVANSCAHRAERVALLMLLSAKLPGFVQSNPPKHINSATALPLAPSAQQFFIKGEPEIADVYFPWLVNLMCPVYWVYLVMAARRRTREARGTAEGTHRSRAESCTNGGVPDRACADRTRRARGRPEHPRPAGAIARPLPALCQLVCHPDGR